MTGYLQRVAFEDGANVQAGDLLFVIEPAPFEADVHSAEAALEKAVAVKQLADVNLTRAHQLQKNNAIAQQEVDIDAAELATASASVRAAEAALQKAKLDLGYAEIRAPISGRIGRHLIDAGNLVNAEQTRLAVIENTDPIYAYFYVSESIVLRFKALVREGKMPDPEKHPPVMHLGLQDEQGFPHEGYLDYRELGVDPSSGTNSRRAVFPNPDHALIPGLFVRLRALLSEPTPQLLVEERAIGVDQRGAYLLVVNDKNVVEYRPVKLGIQVSDLRVIADGIRAEDWVVVNGMQRARPGTPVRPQRAETTIAAGQSTTAPTPSVPQAEGGKAEPDRTPAEPLAPNAAESGSQAPPASASIPLRRGRPDLRC